ncbi:PilZ domain-containing protein [Desulfonatronum sp. SC1]|uniref:PilZ domain-containing protein n=1 Tax=Desulfonatronum sp. SC1 TaxID=2109626 RepID=UPI000D30DE8C|nr:PilZ domain-containing protein [Desulfonatronum sp. SC1]PTN36097.1 hypothetical protein C6366_10175 [Desulfonatronum sp. SC1]
MRVGERLHIKICSTGERLWGELVGFKQGEFLLVWLHNLITKHKIVTENNTVTVRGMNVDYQLCGFKTTVSKIIIKPYPLVFLKFPSFFEKLHLRRHDRMDCFLPAQMLLDGNEYKTMIVNLSQGGARIVLDLNNSDISPDQCEGREVYLVFKTANNDKEVYAKSFVRSANNEARMALGLEFIELIGESHAIIDEYVSSIKEYSTFK